MICFVRRSTIDYDIRLKKYVDACIGTNTPYIAITWDRLEDSMSRYPYEYQYKAKAPYGGGGNNLLQFVGFVFFLYWNLLIRFKKYKVIHACNLEIFILVFPFKFLGKKVFFDIYDSVNTKVESTLCKWTDVLILPHQKRLSQIGITVNDVKRFFVVENVPRFDSNINIKKKDINSHNNIILSYVGVFERNIRGIENIMRLVSEDNRLELHIAGVGAGMESLVEEYANKCSRIIYYGKVSYEKALSIMNNSHFIIALYYLSNPLHKYASPNKFYESLFLGIPIITSSNTLVGDRVKDGNTGYVVDDNYDSLKSVFDNLSTEEFAMCYKTKSENCSHIWQTKYNSYFDVVLKQEYINLINEESK